MPKAASAVLVQTFYEDNLDIAFIQEPYIYGNQITGLPEFTNKDQIAVKVNLSLGENTQELNICSAYLPGNSRDYESLPLQGLVDYCGRQKLQLIVGCDANAHNTIWGSSNINQRGEYLLEFISLNRLEILNVGNCPTFRNSIREEVLDLTLSSPFITNFVNKWKVAREISLSDHMHIRFEIEITLPTATTYRRPRTTDWNLYDALP
ncbi:uncharacterized protein LOC118742333 [Rhagoletis pomonella]|uniref:uncharacterized protein LOC118742333 n=1 Tax=Rhagoletis pomonella TaxID=28610 RepID=UPI00178478D3|nr:uncharacterized protein LOC118742333 [Rhagoletis pomonella]